MLEWVTLILIGVFAAFAGSIVGLGGGFIIVPVIALLYEWPATQIVGTSMVVLVISSLSSSIGFWKQQRIDWRSGLWFALFMIPGSIVGAWLTTMMSDARFYLLFGCFLFLMAFRVVFKPSGSWKWPLRSTIHRKWMDASGHVFEYDYSLLTGLVAALVTGVLSSLFGIGGGSLMVPVMVLLLRFPPHIATATSMFSIFFASLVGSGAHAVYDHIEWGYALLLASGAWLGGQFGARYAKRLSDVMIMRALAGCMVLVAIRLIIKSSEGI